MKKIMFVMMTVIFMMACGGEAVSTDNDTAVPDTAVEDADSIENTDATPDADFTEEIDAEADTVTEDDPDTTPEPDTDTDPKPDTDSDDLPDTEAPDDVMPLCDDGDIRDIPCPDNEARVIKQICNDEIWSNISNVCKCPANKVFCNEDNNHHWWSDPLRAVTFEEAQEHCKKIGGKMPSIEDWQWTIRNCPYTEPYNGIQDACRLTWDGPTKTCKCEELTPNNYGYYSIFGDTVYTEEDPGYHDGHHTFWSGSPIKEDGEYYIFEVNYAGISRAYPNVNTGSGKLRDIRCIQ